MNDLIAIDLTRLSIGPAWPTPRGIDRVDLAYAEHFLERWSGDCVGTLSTPWGAHLLDRDRAVRVVKAVEQLWGESTLPDRDSAYTKVKGFLTDADHTPQITARPSTLRRIASTAKHVLREAGIPLGSSVKKRLPENAVYLNTGQIGIADIRLLSWLDKRQDIRPVFMLHDTIPIDFPEHVPVQSKHYHHKMIANAARYAQGLIVTTNAAESDVRRELTASGRPDIQVAAAPLPPSAAFLSTIVADDTLGDSPYFVVCGAIEPRKNHLLLLNVWRELVRKEGAAAPKLIIVGKRWNAGTEAQNMLDRSPALQSKVFEVEGLSTPSLVKLLAGAQALLMPSFAEGFGLPIVEALSVGTPVIASDIPAHMEAGGESATYLSPIDGLGWLSSVQDHLANYHVHRANASSFLPGSWTQYFERIEPFLESIAAMDAQQVLAPDGTFVGPAPSRVAAE